LFFYAAIPVRIHSILISIIVNRYKTLKRLEANDIDIGMTYENTTGQRKAKEERKEEVIKAQIPCPKTAEAFRQEAGDKKTKNTGTRVDWEYRGTRSDTINATREQFTTESLLITMSWEQQNDDQRLFTNFSSKQNYGSHESYDAAPIPRFLFISTTPLFSSSDKFNMT
jgi:hypothetical protein